MPNYLSENDWKTELKKKENKDATSTGISEALRDYAKKANVGGQEADKALEALVKTADKAKTKYKTLKGLVKYLDEIVTEASAERQKIAQAQPAPDKGQDLAALLAQRLNAVKSLSADNAYNFVSAPGRTSGLWVTKSAVTGEHKKIAGEQRGKGVSGPYYTGVAYGENGKLIFDFGADKPPQGIAKAIGKAIRGYAGLTYKPIVRGGGVSTEEDDDHEANFELPFEEATGLQDARAASADAGKKPLVYRTKEQWATWLKSIANGATPAAKESVAEGIVAMARMELNQSKTDESLAADAKAAISQLLGHVIDSADKLATQAPARPTTAAPQSATIAQRRAEITGMMGKNVALIEKAAFPPGGSAAISKRPELMIGGRLDKVCQALANCEKDKSAANLKAVREACNDAEKKFQQIDALRADPFPAGAAQAVLDQTDLKQSADFKRCAQAFAYGEAVAAEKPEDTDDARAAHQADLLAAAKKLTAECDRYFKKRGNPPENSFTAEDKIVKGWKDTAWLLENKELVDKQAGVVLLAQTRVRLTEIAAQYQTLGDPAKWTRDQEEIASELQAAYLFEEGTVTSKAAFGAAGSDSQTLNSTYRVQRKNPQRTNTDPAAADSENLYIFKPMEGEDSVAAGLAAGSGAAREVFAKDLADFLETTTGIKSKVCATNFVSLERSKLPGANGATGSIKGSMQRLASKVEAGIGPALKKDAALAAKIDKDEFDDIAVLDLIMGNLDRHGNNILLAKKPNGDPEMVAIDHGTSIPSPETLKLNRNRIHGVQNFMTSDSMPQSGQPLGKKALDRLANLKPDDMVKALRGSQDRLRQRHPELAAPEMGLSDPQLKLMERSALFIKAAGGLIPVRDLFQAKARFVDDLMQDPEPDWPKLAAKIAAQIKADNAALDSISTLIPKGDNWGQFPYQLLTQLGWCVGMSDSDMEQWIKDNPQRAIKIVSCRIPNPNLKEQVDALCGVLGGAPNVPAGSGSQTDLMAEYSKLRSQLGSPASDKMDKTALDQEYIRLGGDKVLAEACAVCNSDRLEIRALEDATRNAKKQKEESRHNEIRRKVQCLHFWEKFQAAGGISALAKAGGAQPANSRDGLEQLIALQSMSKASGSVDKITPEQATAQQQAELKRLLAHLAAGIPKVLSPNFVTTATGFQTRFDQIKADYQKDKNDLKAVTDLARVGRFLDERLTLEADMLAKHKQEHADIVKLVGNSKIDGALQKRIGDLGGMPDADVVIKNLEVVKDRTRLQFEVDAAINAGTSAFATNKATLDGLKATWGKNWSDPFYANLGKLHGDLTAALTNYELANLPEGAKQLGDLCAKIQEIEKLRGAQAKMASTEDGAAMTKAMSEVEKAIKTAPASQKGNDAVETKLKKARALAATAD